LWQGASVLEAEAIELNRGERSLSATGNVRAVFPRSDAASKKNASSGPTAALWHVSADSLKYWDKESRAHLEQNVTIQSANNRIRGTVMDLYFARAGAKGAATGSSAGAGAREISRAVAAGGVIVEQGERRATADRGEYTAADGKFVMSGGNPTIFDAASGTTTGRQLTFFLADDTIIVDSEKGSRTLTKHRVE
jgi:lipopolysaccharide export system protein LptA